MFEIWIECTQQQIYLNPLSDFLINSYNSSVSFLKRTLKGAKFVLKRTLKGAKFVQKNAHRHSYLQNTICKGHALVKGK